MQNQTLQKFQWAPTLGGECYGGLVCFIQASLLLFQWAPTLGGECYLQCVFSCLHAGLCRFNGHPPLGVNATLKKRAILIK